MLRVANGYVFLLLGLSIYNQNAMQESIDFVYISTLLIPTFGLFFNFKYFSLIYCLVLLSIYAYSLSSFHNMAFFQKVLINQNDFLRYGLYYLYITLSIKDRQEAVHRLPYCGVVSNFGYIIEKRFVEIHEKLNIPIHRNFQAGIFTILAVIFLIITKANFVKSHLFNDVTRYRRSLIQSSLLMSSYTTTFIIIKNIEKIQITSTRFFDVIPLISSFLIIFINQKFLQYIDFKYYRFFGIVINLLCTVLLHFFTLQHYVLKVFVITTLGFHYMISDPCRYMFYIMHSVDIIPYFITFDLIGLCICKFVLEFFSNLYINYVILPLWLYAIIFSSKYHEKDTYCEKCVQVLEV